MAERAAWGFNANPTYVRSILATNQDIGTDTLGLPMTEEEIAELDLPGRGAFEQQVHSHLMSAVEQIDSFAGAYFAQEDGGSLHLMFTDRNAARERELLSRISNPLRPIHFDVAAVPIGKLRAALEPAWAVVKSLRLTAYEIGVDDRANTVIISVDSGDLSAAHTLQPRISETLGVPVEIRVGYQAIPQTCNDREHCTNPMKSGTVIRNGSTSGSRCTMGFHIRIGTDEQFVTAGHCGLNGSNNWYHQGYGLVGAKISNLIYSGYDAVRVQMPDSQASSVMYPGYGVGGWIYPVAGQAFIVSFGVSNKQDAGIVERTWTSWTYSGTGSCNCTVYGGSHKQTSGTAGDSGSPMISTNGSNPFGINVAGDGTGRGFYTRVGDLMTTWNWGDVVH